MCDVMWRSLIEKYPEIYDFISLKDIRVVDEIIVPESAQICTDMKDFTVFMKYFDIYFYVIYFFIHPVFVVENQRLLPLDSPICFARSIRGYAVRSDRMHSCIKYKSFCHKLCEVYVSIGFRITTESGNHHCNKIFKREMVRENYSID